MYPASPRARGLLWTGDPADRVRDQQARTLQAPELATLVQKDEEPPPPVRAIQTEL